MIILYVLGGSSLFFIIISSFLYLKSIKQKSDLENDLSLLQEKLNSSEKVAELLSADIKILNDKFEKLQSSNLKLIEEKAEAQTLNFQIPELKKEINNISTEVLSLNQIKENQAVEIERLETLLLEEKKHFVEKLLLLDETKNQLKIEFENLAGSILTENSKRFAEQNKSDMDIILSPFKTQIADFKKKVEDLYIDEAKERSSLKVEIESLRKLNEQISNEAENLTNALKQDVKSQGDWGEIKLEMVLQASGLTKGLEYDVQLNLKDENGTNFRPDVVVHLPDNRDIIIDSKVSLTAYERYVNADSNAAKEIAMKEHVISLKKHIRELSEKNYHKLYGINSLDFVLMFVYNEASYIAAIDYDRELLKEAFNKKILIAAPFTLYGTLKIINSLWKYDEQNKNAREIADRAAKLYDKFVGFVETFKVVGSNIHKVNASYNDALKKLATGKGNLIGQTEKLVELGVVPNKALPDNLETLSLVEGDNS